MRADPDGGHVDTLARAAQRLPHEAFGRGVADIGVLVGEQHQPGLAAAIRQFGKGGFEPEPEPRFHVGRTVDVDRLDSALERGAVAFDIHHGLVDHGFRAIDHDPEPVTLAHLAQHRAQAFLDPRDGLARHRARAVDHGDEAERLGLVGRRIHIAVEADPHELRSPVPARGLGMGDNAEQLAAGRAARQDEVVFAQQAFGGEAGRLRQLARQIIERDRAEVLHIFCAALGHAHGGGYDDLLIGSIVLLDLDLVLGRIGGGVLRERRSGQQRQTCAHHQSAAGRRNEAHGSSPLVCRARLTRFASRS